MMIATIRKSLRSLVLLAMLLPFLMAALIARGVMPGLSAEGGFTVVLCTADGPVSHRLAADGGDAPPAGGGAGHPCAHATAHAAFTLPAAILPPSRPFGAVARLGRAVAVLDATPASPRRSVMVGGPPRAG